MASTNPARGMRDFLPADVRKRNYVIGIIKEVYESYGFEPLETPSVENLETLMGKYGDEGNQLVFKILKRGEKLDLEKATKESDLSDLALRYDLTVPLARVVANNKNDLPKFFKRYQIQPVWRADRPARGRFREFYQCDVDAIGSESILVEIELMSAVNDILMRLGFKNFVIKINNRKVLTSLLNSVGVSSDKHIDALMALDKIDKIGRDNVVKEFEERGIGIEARTKLSAAIDLFIGSPSTSTMMSGKERLNFLKIFKSYKEIIDVYDGYVMQADAAVESGELEPVVSELLTEVQNAIVSLRVLKNLKELIGNDPEGLKGLKNINELWSHVNRLGFIFKIRIDPTLARGLSYYTGTIMEINVPDLAGSLGGGGRYDGLIGMFGKEQIPACGFSLGLERILVVMEERGMFPPEIAESTPADVMVTIWSDETIADSLKLANELRGQGLRVTLYPEADKLGKQFKYADSIHVPFVCVLGEAELADGRITLKNMSNGEQAGYDRANIGAIAEVCRS